MTELELIAPVTTTTVGFSLAPARNGLQDLLLITEAENTSGFDEWVYQTVARLPAERLRVNRLVVHPLCVGCHLDNVAWPGFVAWVDDLAARDAHAMRDVVLENLIDEARETLGDTDGGIPDVLQLAGDRAAYISLIDRVSEQKYKHEPPDRALQEEAHAYLADPPAMQDLVVTHLRTMWDEVLAEEWERNLPLLQASVAAFQSLDFGGVSMSDALPRVTGRDLPADWEEKEKGADRIVFIPSAHIGPYLLWLGTDERTAHIVFRAHVPEGVSAGEPALSRSELLMRLSALADDTRLRILERLARDGEMGAQDVMARLDISQSAASRHLRQLVATGYLAARRHEGAKLYRVNRGRIDDTLDAVKQCCECCEDEPSGRAVDGN
jgi:DNA-binding transcriptional ArsR family regulator